MGGVLLSKSLISARLEAAFSDPVSCLSTGQSQLTEKMIFEVQFIDMIRIRIGPQQGV